MFFQTTTKNTLPHATGRFLELQGVSRFLKIQFCLFALLGVVLSAYFASIWFAPEHIPSNFSGWWHILDYLLFFVLSYIVWHHILMELFSWYITAYIQQPVAQPVVDMSLRVAYCTAYVPGSEPYDILEQTLKAMVAVDYPHDTWLLDEGNDVEAKRICKKYGVHHFSRHGKEEFNGLSGRFKRKTKGGNYNSWLHHYSDRYDIVAQHDVDFIPRSDFLTKTLGYFSDPTVAFVGTPQVYGNENESWIARGAAEQTYGFYGPIQKGFYGHNMTLLIGANHIMRMKAYQDIDGYTAHIAEDMLTGMKLYAHEGQWKSVYVPEALLIGEGPATWDAYLVQQMRWAFGCMDILFRHAPPLFLRMNPRKVINYLLLQQFYFSGIAQAVGVGLMMLYFFAGINSAAMALGSSILLLYTILVLYQTLFQMWLQRFNIMPETENGLLLRGKVLGVAAWPIYFLAFVSVVFKWQLTYKVTPKGSSQSVAYVPTLFIPHFILGTITLVGILWGLNVGRTAGPIVFWALLNTGFMYFFYFSQAIPSLVQNVRRSVVWQRKVVDLPLN